MGGFCLLTGVTGLVGRYLLRDLLLSGVPVAVLIRAREGEAPAERLEEILRYWDREEGRPLPRTIYCLEGDITLPGLGLGDGDRRWIANHCVRVLHNAASLTFWGKDRAKDPWSSNLGGTEQVLNLCRTVGLREFHYVSTAYVCGQREGPIREDELNCGQEFRNDYEECKFQAETLVRSADFLDDVTVYRPAIITGDSRNGFTSTYHGLYSYLHFPSLVLRYLPADPDGRLHADLRLNLTGDEGRNLVPVDWVSAAITHLVTDPTHHGRTYHLTPTVPTTAREIMEAMLEFYHIYGPRFVGPEGLAHASLNELESAFYDYVGRYEPYWSKEPIFDRRNWEKAAPNLPCPPVDKPCLRRLLEFAVKDNWGKRRKTKK